MTAYVEYCGEQVPVPVDRPFVLGRDGDLVIDDNPFLHRHFLVIEHTDTLWWLSNVGGRLSATVADTGGLVTAWLSPGARLPVVFRRTCVRFTAGPTTYDFELELGEEATFTASPHLGRSGLETMTIGRVELTPEQRLLVLALCEPVLRRADRGPGTVPSSRQASARLGWPLTKFNRKLDAVCQKLSSAGVRGLHGSPGELASSRRARLVEYALSVRLVAPDDLHELQTGGCAAP